MTEAFIGYSEDFEQCRDEAVTAIRAVAKARDAGERLERSERAQGHISEAERYMRILESESRAGDSQDRRRMHQQLRTGHGPGVRDDAARTRGRGRGGWELATSAVNRGREAEVGTARASARARPCVDGQA